MVSLGVVAALALATAVPAWAQEPPSEYVDPTIVNDETPEGVKNLGAEQTVTKKKWENASPPVYTKWWFWATAVAVTAATVFLAITPFAGQARGCIKSDPKNPGRVIPLNCFGDGRGKETMP